MRVFRWVAVVVVAVSLGYLIVSPSQVVGQTTTDTSKTETTNTTQPPQQSGGGGCC